jgi:type II secretory pathway component PulF
MKYEEYGSKQKTITVEAETPQAAAAVLRAEGFTHIQLSRSTRPGRTQ